MKKAATALIPTMPRVGTRGGERGEITVAVHMVGGLGDNIISLTWMRELYIHAEIPLHIDFYGRLSSFSLIAAGQSFIRGCYYAALFKAAQGYDIKLRILNFVEIVSASMKKLEIQAPTLARILKQYDAHNKKLSQYYKLASKTESHNALADYDILVKRNRWDRLRAEGAFPFGTATPPSIFLEAESMAIPESVGLDERRFITLNTGVDEVVTEGVPPKSWPVANFSCLVRMLKAEFPELLFVQLGGGRSPKIPEVDIDLVGKTTLQEAAVILKQAALHIDGEGGLVHLRRALGGKSVVLFGPTPAAIFGYAENINLVSDFCSPCMWMIRDWMKGCMRGFPEAECLKRLAPETVAVAVKKHLNFQVSYIYLLTDISLYTSEARQNFEPLLDDMLQICGLEKKPISQHILGPGRICYIHASKQWEYPYAISQINAMGEKKLKIADIGGGRGALSWYLAEKGHDVTAFDINFKWDAKGDAEIEQKYVAFAKSKGFTAAFGSVFNIPAPDSSFDVVTSISVVEHIPHKYYAIQEMLRVLKPGGKLILTYDLVLTHHLNRSEGSRLEIFTPENIRLCLAKLGLKVEETYTEADVEASIACVLADNLLEGVKDCTFGALVIEKSVANR